MNTIQVEKRDFSKKAKQLRRGGIVPGSIYGGPLKELNNDDIECRLARKKWF